jgi:hypothetical protein
MVGTIPFTATATLRMRTLQPLSESSGVKRSVIYLASQSVSQSVSQSMSDMARLLIRDPFNVICIYNVNGPICI